MPQTTVIPAWKANYPLFTKAQKPSGITPATTLGASAVPNQVPQGTPTIQIAQLESVPE
jgi:hypothetical protein